MWHKSVFDVPGVAMSNSSSSLELLADDDVITSLDVDPFTSPSGVRHDSYVGALPSSPSSVAEAVRTRHVGFASAIAELEWVCEAFDAVDPSAAAAQTSLRRRVGSLAMLASLLETVSSYADAPETEPLFASDGLLAAYVAGIYLWAGDVTDTLKTVARDLNTLAPNWAAFRERLGEVAWIFDMAVTEGKRIESVLDLVPADIHESLDELYVALITLRHKLDEPFG
jgi:hypothetical protein